MENQIQPRERDIDVITTEIKTICEQARVLALTYAIEIGRRLEEAKDMLPHGEWGTWLREKVQFSQASANNYMRLFDEYGDKQITLFGAELNSQAFGNLTYTKALKLLALPEGERENFVEENDIENMSTRELDKLIKERDEALKKAEEADKLRQAVDEANSEIERYKQTSADIEKETADLKNEIAELTQKLEKAKDSEKKTKAKLKELKDNPDVPQDVIDKIKAEAEESASAEQAKIIEEKIAEANRKIAEAVSAKQAAEQKAEQANARAEDLKKQIQMSNPAVTEFKALFEQTQQDMSRMMRVLENIEDVDISEKLHAAVNAFLQQYAK